MQASLGAIAATGGSMHAERQLAQSPVVGDARPWFRRTCRWVQTNLNEDDPASYDQAFWTAYWHRTHAQGVIVNAGGIVAYYPTRFEWHHRADRLGSRDLLGEIAAAARAEQLTFVARMDSTRTYEEVFKAHPDWFARMRDGAPFRAGRLYTVCVNGPWLTECVPAMLREIAERYRPDGFTDNSWSGLGQDSICYCAHCDRRFRDTSGLSLPERVDWNDRPYREWIAWNYERRVEIWEAHNRVTHEAGGPDCDWAGMVQGDPARMCAEFRSPSRLLSRARIVMLDWQARAPNEAPYVNAVAGHFIRSVVGPATLAPESTPLYQGPSSPIFRHAAKPEPEARLWAIEGWAGGIQPWFHHLGASQWDQRQFRAAGPLGQWHAAHQDVLVDREPLAAVAVAWSERNIDWYGRGESAERVRRPFHGVVDALVAHRIPWIAVDLDRLEDALAPTCTLVLPDVAAMSSAQCEAVRRFVARGGGLVATGETSRRDEWGDPLADFALADVLGAHAVGEARGAYAGQVSAWSSPDGHTYLERRGADAATARGDEIFAGLEDTSVFPFGGRLTVVKAADDARVALWSVPPYPASPPEDVRRGAGESAPALLLRAPAGSGRVAFVPADLDRCFNRDRLPDHGRLLANILRWATTAPIPVEVAGPGLLDVHLYRQDRRLVLHIVNLTNPATWRAPVTEVYPVGPLEVQVRVPSGVHARAARCLVDVTQRPVLSRTADDLRFVIGSVLDHEVIVIE
jgi:hypothetical protein